VIFLLQIIPQNDTFSPSVVNLFIFEEVRDAVLFIFITNYTNIRNQVEKMREGYRGITSTVVFPVRGI